MSGRVVGIGLDALSPVLLRRWMADGTLPNLRDLASGGVSGDVAGVEGFYVGATWPSFWTGRHPASHGMHYELQIEPGTYDMLRIQATPEYVAGEPLWEALSRQGRRVAVLDIPLSRLSEPGRLEGVQVVDWGGHDKFFGFRTTPAALGEEILRRHGPHLHRTKCDVTRSSVEEYEELVEDLLAGIEAKVSWTLDLMTRERWDLLLQVFTESHCIGHQAWHLHDPTHPSHDPDMRDALGYDPVRRVYQALDDAVGRLAEATGDARLIVWSGHGMDFWRGADFVLPEILYRLGVTERPAAPGALRQTASRLIDGMRRRTPGPMRALADRLRERHATHGTVDKPAPPIQADAAASLCFPIRNGASVGGIRLNLVGREPSGRIRPGAEADAFCDRLIEELLAIRDERTGGQLIARVVRTEDLYSGPRRDQLPDLLIEWSADVPTGSMVVSGGRASRVEASSPKIGTVEGVNWFGRTGGHRPGGWIIAAGDGVAPSRLEHAVSLFDLAPTMAAMVGARMDGADGAPSEELLRSVRPGVPQPDAR